MSSLTGPFIGFSKRSTIWIQFVSPVCWSLITPPNCLHAILIPATVPPTISDHGLQILFLFYAPSLAQTLFPPACLQSSPVFQSPAGTPFSAGRLTQLCCLESTLFFAILSSVNFICVSFPVLACGQGLQGTCWSIPGIMKQAVEEWHRTHLLERAYESYSKLFSIHFCYHSLNIPEFNSFLP